jgi:uncharacterized membrane-anchored protein YitT (DUF2179 family)
MNYLLLSDGLWYMGHILTGLSVVFSQNHFYTAISLVFVGQFITIISRPISRVKVSSKEKKVETVEKEDYNTTIPV